MKATLREIRGKGYPLSVGEGGSGMIGIAAPIFGVHRSVIGSIRVLRATSALDTRRFRTESKALIDIAARLSRPAGKDD